MLFGRLSSDNEFQGLPLCWLKGDLHQGFCSSFVPLITCAMSHNKLSDPYSPSLLFRRPLPLHLCAAFFRGWKAFHLTSLYVQTTPHLWPPQLPSSALTSRCKWSPLSPICTAASPTAALIIHQLQRHRQRGRAKWCARRAGCTFVPSPSHFK